MSADGRVSLIPTERTHVEQLCRFECQCAAADAHRSLYRTSYGCARPRVRRATKNSYA